MTQSIISAPECSPFTAHNRIIISVEENKTRINVPECQFSAYFSTSHVQCSTDGGEDIDKNTLWLIVQCATVCTDSGRAND